MDQVYVTSRLQTLLTRAEAEAKRLKDDYVSVEHVLLAATDEKVFKDLAITRERLMRTLQEVRGIAAGDHAEPREHLRGSRKVRPRSDQAGGSRQARPGDRAR